MKEWSDCKIWPFSSYGFVRDKPSCFDFPDYSPEEMRFEFYKSQSDGSQEHYIKQAVELGRQYRTARKKFINLNRNSDDYGALMEIVRCHLAGNSNIPSKYIKLFQFAASNTSTAPGARATTFGSLSSPSREVQSFGKHSPTTPMSVTSFSFKPPAQNSPHPTKNSRTRELTQKEKGYSIESQLSAQQIKAFEACRFVIGQVPDLPPTEILCGL